jgi:hypothetical protein
MRVTGEFTIVLRGSTDRTRKVGPSSWSGFQYLIQRLVIGEEVAASEFPHYGLQVSVQPGAARDPWDHGINPPCPHNWIEITTKNDRHRRWQCSTCDAEISKAR